MSDQSRQTYIPLKEVVEIYGISEEVLLERVESGQVASGRLPDGVLLVAEQDIDPSLVISREDFAHLSGHRIGVREAGKKYGIASATLSRWAHSGYIKVLERGYRLYLDEADVAYCTAVYQAKYEFYGGRMAGVTIFDEQGNPYRVKHREIAARMRAERRQKRESNQK